MRRSAELTFLVFTVLGPPIGLVSFGLMSAAWAFRTTPLATVLEGLLGFLLGGLVASYIGGLVPALVSGGLVVWSRKRRPGYEPLWVASVGMLVGVAYAFCWSMILDLLGGEMFEDRNRWLLLNLLLLALTCLVSTLACWAILRRWDEPERIPV